VAFGFGLGSGSSTTSSGAPPAAAKEPGFTQVMSPCGFLISRLVK
jgi:hypothetical protein